MNQQLSKQQLDKLGNTLIYLSNGVGEFCLTKALKLVFLLEENSIKKFGHPFIGIDFQVWHLGPVSTDVYFELIEEEMPLLGKYIKRADYNPEIIEAATEFIDDEFSDNDIELMDEMLAFSKHKIAKDLVAYTHSENSLWRKMAIRLGILELLESKQMKSTTEYIDFTMLFDDDENMPDREFMKDRYLTSLESLQFINHLKG